MARRPRRRRGRRGRPPKPVTLGRTPAANRFVPVPQVVSEPIYIEPAEVEALRLVDLRGLSQEEAGERMSISRGTVWRLLHRGRKKTVEALVKARPLVISTWPTPRSQSEAEE